MRLPPGYLAAAATAALSFQSAGTLIQAVRGSTSAGEAVDPPVCETDQLNLVVSQSNGTAVFRCPLTLPVLAPEYSKLHPLVFYRDRPRVLTEILTDATLLETPVPPAAPDGNGEVASVIDIPDQYTLVVPVLPEREKMFSFKCEPMSEENMPVAQRESMVAQSCEVIVTVTSAGNSAAFSSAGNTLAIAGLVSLATSGIAPLPA
ncbi:hypothetical protein BESB_081640 [Besnoitia besnoiti]|uniref:SRS domain-containing protein n=1 Tax=Besnoitia besnoiti TaxID=94643 RepID=A0A2A9M4S5_BESBE|nr:hypothetical protein BESB_081640 [Besnoitia besnoiti]PFH32965.1 hypothetical protein BESB_081640 [Besnoitia besnoiti]